MSKTFSQWKSERPDEIKRALRPGEEPAQLRRLSVTFTKQGERAASKMLGELLEEALRSQKR